VRSTRKWSRMPRREWVVHEADEAICQRFIDEMDLTPLSARILYNRGIRDGEDAHRFLNASLHHLNAPSLFPDMETAVERIHLAVVRKEKVLVYGDYDVDGLTGTAVLVHFLRTLGLEPCFHVPDRLLEGYGFHSEALPGFLEQGIRLIVTVDCGISAVEAVQEANRLGIDVIITDHHECTLPLPPALAILNPKIPGSGFPFRDLAGVGVAFYLIIALRKRFRETGIWVEIPEPNLVEYLDLVTLGTLADMVPLRQENRVFVKFGLQEITKGKRPGVQILKEQAGIQGDVCQTRPLIFRMIPRINAPGRMGCSGVSLDILLCEETDRARQISRVLEGRNRERKTMEERVHRQARVMAQKQVDLDRTVLVLAADDWHRGILGIVASRIAQEFRRPAALVSFQGEMGKGSIRSIDDLDILEAVLACRLLLEDFGGHRMAAGFSLKRHNLEDFQDAFEKAVLRKLQRGHEYPSRLVLDSWVRNPEELNARFLEELVKIGPFGYGNEEPVLGIRGVKIVKKEVVGGSHLKLVLAFGAARFESIGFGMGKDRGIMENDCGLWDVAFTPQQEVWKGRARTSFRIVAIQPS
jgi:single-stranded-DNA-specific exonuclease